MLIIQNGSQVEPLNHIQNLEVNQEVNGAYTASFTSFNYPNNPGYMLLEEESILIVEDQEFRVKQLEENLHSKRIVAIHTFYDLADQRQDEIYGGTRTFNEFAAFVLKGTGWTFSSTVTGSRFIENFGEENIIVLINALCTVYECEYEIRVNKHVHFAPIIGPDNDDQYRYGHNVKALSKKVDTTNLKTYIEGYGADGLFVSYTSPLASNPKFGIKKADPVRDDRFTQSDSMLEHLKRELNDKIEAFFELDSVELINKELGERVWLIYEPLDIEFQTRILKQTKTIRNGKLVNTKVILGNTLPKSTTDILVSQKVEIDENRKQVQSRFEQVNDRITAEVEEVGHSIAGLEIQVGQVEIYAEQIDQSVAALNVKADNISLSVTDLSGRLGNAESSIKIQANQIASKVEQRDYNGNTIASLINQTAYGIQIEASKINLNGYVTISSLNSPGAVTINEGNIVGSSFTVGRGTGNPSLSMYAAYGSHRIYSQDAAGFRIQSNGTLSLQADGGTVYSNSKLWASNGFQVSGFSQMGEISAGTVNASQLIVNGSGVVNVNSVQSMINSAVAQLERDLVAWTNTYFVRK